MYKGQQVDWWINIMAVHHSGITPDGRMPMEELSIDGVLNNWEDTLDVDTRLRSWRNWSLPALVGDQKPNKSSVPRARFLTGDSFIRNTARHCNFAGDECWNVRTHAVIDSISASQGNTNGGQELTIKGWGFENGADITVAGVACEVVSSTMEEVKCITGESLAASTDNVNQPGQPGIARREYNPAISNRTPSMNDLRANPPTYAMTGERLELVLE